MMKPTLRKSGRVMVTFTVKHHVDVHDVIRAMVYNHGWYGTHIPTSRAAALKMTKEFVGQYGWDNWSQVNSELMEQYGTLCAIKAQELFPDMAKGLDLSGYNGEW